MNSNDSVTILSMLENHNVNSVSVFTVANNLSYWLPKAKAAEAADANADKVINKSDSDSILNYYALSMANNYRGNIGKYFYTIKAI